MTTINNWYRKKSRTKLEVPANDIQVTGNLHRWLSSLSIRLNILYSANVPFPVLMVLSAWGKSNEVTWNANSLLCSVVYIIPKTMLVSCWHHRWRNVNKYVLTLHRHVFYRLKCWLLIPWLGGNGVSSARSFVKNQQLTSGPLIQWFPGCRLPAALSMDEKFSFSPVILRCYDDPYLCLSTDEDFCIIFFHLLLWNNL